MRQSPHSRSRRRQHSSTPSVYKRSQHQHTRTPEKYIKEKSTLRSIPTASPVLQHYRRCSAAPRKYLFRDFPFTPIDERTDAHKHIRDLTSLLNLMLLQRWLFSMWCTISWCRSKATWIVRLDAKRRYSGK